MIIPQLKKWDAHVSTEWKYPRIFRNRCFGPSVLAATVWQKGTLATICFYSCTSSGVHSSTEVLDEQKQFHPMNIALHATLQLTIQKGSQWLAAARSLLYRERAAKPNSVKSHATACYSRVPVLAFFCWGYHFWEETAGSTETANSRLTDPYCWCSCPASGFSTDKKRSVHQDLVTKKFSAPSTTLYRTPWLGSFGLTQIVWQGQGQTKCRHGFLPVLPADSYGFQLDDPLLQKETKGVKPQPLLLLDLHEHHRSWMQSCRLQARWWQEISKRGTVCRVHT